MTMVKASAWVITYDLPSDEGHRRAVARFYRFLARIRRQYPGLVERPTLSTLVLGTETLARMVVRAVELAGGRYTIDRSMAGQPVGLEAYILQSR